MGFKKACVIVWYVFVFVLGHLSLSKLVFDGTTGKKKKEKYILAIKVNWMCS